MLQLRSSRRSRRRQREDVLPSLHLCDEYVNLAYFVLCPLFLLHTPAPHLATPFGSAIGMLFVAYNVIELVIITRHAYPGHCGLIYAKGKVHMYHIGNNAVIPSYPVFPLKPPQQSTCT